MQIPSTDHESKWGLFPRHIEAKRKEERTLRNSLVTPWKEKKNA